MQATARTYRNDSLFSDSLENLVRRGAMYTKRKKSSHDRILMADFHDCDENCVDGCPYENSQRDSQDIGDTVM